MLEWLEHQMTTSGSTIEAVVQEEHRRQAAMNVTVRNIVTSMREISAINWQDIFERVGLADRLLRDEAGFGRLDFRPAISIASRSSYSPVIRGRPNSISPAPSSNSRDLPRRGRW